MSEQAEKLEKTMKKREISGGAGPIVQCKDCRETFRDVKWTQGIQCPKCQSRNFMPVAIIHGAIDYTLADRRKGFALEDIRLGKIAVWADLITPYQYNQALTKQKSYLSRDKEAPPLGQVMVEAKMLSETAVAAILGVLARRRPDPDDTDFGQIAVQNKLVDKERIDECTKLQTDYALEHNEVPPLGVMLFEKRCLQENQTIAIYKAQERKGRGLLRDIKTAIEENREETLLERIYPKDDPVRQKQVIVGGILGFIILLIWGKFLFFSGGAVKIDTYCNACQRVAKAKWSGEELPMKCKLCGKKEAFAALKCRRDGEVFGVNDPFTPGSRCPKCGGTNARPPSETD